MNSIRIQDTDDIFEDVQIWYRHKLPISSKEIFQRITYVNYQKVPIYLLQSSVVDVYSNSDATEDYIRQKLVKYNSSKGLGLLFRSSVNENIYIILFVQDFKVKGFILDYTILGKLSELQDNNGDGNYLIDLKTRQNSVHVIDKVLEKKKRAKSTTPNPPPSQPQNNPDQINSMVSKVILSGLRLRGLSTNSSSTPNDKVRIKEIYSITYKSTLFALRKFGNNTIKLNDVQEIVEKLLQIYIDVGSNDNPFID